MVQTQINNLRAAPATTVAELQDVLADRARDYHDMTVRARRLRYDPDIGMIEVQGRGEYGLRNLALSQIAGKLGVPANYLRKCPWELRAENVNAVTRAGNSYELPLDSRLKLQEAGGRVLKAAESGARWLNWECREPGVCQPRVPDPIASCP